MVNNELSVKPNVTGISNVESLASLLSTPYEDLIAIADNVDRYWKPGATLYKKDGTPRPTQDAKEPLKSIHETIKNRLLKKINYPKYLLGGISDPEFPRSCMVHASIHTGAKVLISEDVKDFYPSTTAESIHRIWKYCFNFSNEVAAILTKLTTYKNELPQGWKTSGYLANLVFWDVEPELVTQLRLKGYRYSRFMDDITVSSERILRNNEKGEAISLIYRMLFNKGCRPKRTKHEIAPATRAMKVTNLLVNAGRVTIPKKERKNVRAQIFQLENRFPHDALKAEYESDWNSSMGKASRIRKYHIKEGEELQNRLRRIKPRKTN